MELTRRRREILAVWQAFPLRNQRFCTPNHHFFAPIHRDVVLAQIRAPKKEGGDSRVGGTVVLILIPPDTRVEHVVSTV